MKTDPSLKPSIPLLVVISDRKRANKMTSESIRVDRNLQTALFDIAFVFEMLIIDVSQPAIGSHRYGIRRRRYFLENPVVHSSAYNDDNIKRCT